MRGRIGCHSSFRIPSSPIDASDSLTGEEEEVNAARVLIETFIRDRNPSDPFIATVFPNRIISSNVRSIHDPTLSPPEN